MRAENQLKPIFVRIVTVLLLTFLLSGCSSTFISYPLVDSTRLQKYQSGVIPKSGNFYDYSIGNNNNIILYSYDDDEMNRITTSSIDIINMNIVTKEYNSSLIIPSFNKSITSIYYEYLWVYNDSKTNDITAIMNLIEGNQSNFYKVTKDHKTLLFSYPKPIHWSTFGLVDSADQTDVEKMYLFFKQSSHYDVFLISLKVPHIYKNIKFSLNIKNTYCTKNYLYAIEKDTKESKILLIDKNTFDYQYLSYYPEVSFVGVIYKDDTVLVCNHQNCLIEILSPKGIIGTFPSPIYPETLERILVKKYLSDFSMFVIPKMTSYGHDNQCIWVRYSPTKKTISKTYFNLPKQLNYYFTDTYESFSQEEVILGLNHKNRESFLVFFYFNSGKVQFEQIQHQNLGQKCNKNCLIYWPKMRLFTWNERYYEPDGRSFKNYLFYCNLNRFDKLLSRYKTDSVKNID